MKPFRILAATRDTRISAPAFCALCATLAHSRCSGKTERPQFERKRGAVWPGTSRADSSGKCRPERIVPSETKMKEESEFMPVLAKFHGIVMRMLSHRTFGTHLHAIYGDAELVIGLKPVRIIQGEAPSWVRTCVLEWVQQHENDLHLRRTPAPQPPWTLA